MSTRRHGHCAICGKRRTLTWDHVPPTCAYKARRVEIRPLIDSLRGASARPRLSQAGIQFPSICAECNEARLGKEYDPHLREFARAIRSALSASGDLGIALPSPYSITLKAQRVARSVVGHLLASLRMRMSDEPRGTAAHLAKRLKPTFSIRAARSRAASGSTAGSTLIIALSFSGRSCARSMALEAGFWVICSSSFRWHSGLYTTNQAVLN